MIYKNGKLITEVQNNLRINGSLIELKIGAIYKGTKLIWLAIYNAVRSCFGGGTWLQDKPWLDNDTWKNN